MVILQCANWWFSSLQTVSHYQSFCVGFGDSPPNAAALDGKLISKTCWRLYPHFCWVMWNFIGHLPTTVDYQRVILWKTATWCFWSAFFWYEEHHAQLRLNWAWFTEEKFQAQGWTWQISPSLVGGLKHHFDFSIQLGILSSQLTFIFFRGVETTNQIMCQPQSFPMPYAWS